MFREFLWPLVQSLVSHRNRETTSVERAKPRLGLVHFRASGGRTGHCRDKLTLTKCDQEEQWNQSLWLLPVTSTSSSSQFTHDGRSKNNPRSTTDPKQLWQLEGHHTSHNTHMWNFRSVSPKRLWPVTQTKITSQLFRPANGWRLKNQITSPQLLSPWPLGSHLLSPATPRPPKLAECNKTYTW